MSEEKQYPSIPEQAQNLSKFVWDVLRKSFQHQESIFVSDEVAKQRAEICSKCEWFDPVEYRCKNCGCFLGPKIRVSIESCPIGAWTYNSEGWENGGFDMIIEKLQQEEELRKQHEEQMKGGNNNDES